MGGWGGGSWAFCLPFVSQRTWENCGLSWVGHDSGSQLPSPWALQPCFLALPPLPTAAGEAQNWGED